MENINFDIAQIIADPRAGILPVLLVIGWLLKLYPRVKNNWIPGIVVVLGIILGVIFYGAQLGWAGAGVVGFLYGATAIGLHSGTKNSLQDKGPSA